MKKNIYHRLYYLNKIRGFYKHDIIKVITGIRRCGKSCFMLSVIEDLMKMRIPDKDIIYLNLDKRGYKNIKTSEHLEKTIYEYINDDSQKFIFIDEVQNVNGFEEIINALREEGHSIFITGSNSYLLSGELATKLTGRYIEVEMFPLNFYEYMGMKKFLGNDVDKNIMNEFKSYIRDGGFPNSLEFASAEDRDLYARNVIDQIFAKDIAQRYKIRDRNIFNRIRDFCINNFGSITSVGSIVDYFYKNGVNVKRETVQRYIGILEAAKILYKCPRFDLKSKKSLRGEGKYYLADLSIYFCTNNDKRINYGPVLENIVFCYLKSKGHDLSVGRIGKLECDFISRKRDEYFYIQVAMTIMNESTEEREYRPFELIRDNYPKYLFTLDTFEQKRDGIRHVNVADFIADNRDLS